MLTMLYLLSGSFEGSKGMGGNVSYIKMNEKESSQESQHQVAKKMVN